MKRALFIVNPITDFCKNGSFEIPFGENIFATINNIVKYFDVVIVSKEIFSNKLYLENKIKYPFWKQDILSKSELHPSLVFNDKIFDVNIKDENQNFSALQGICKEDNMTVQKYFNIKNIKDVYIVGLPGEYGVKDTALECSKFYNTNVIIDVVKFSDNINKILETLISNNIDIVNSTDLKLLFSESDYYNS